MIWIYEILLKHLLLHLFLTFNMAFYLHFSLKTILQVKKYVDIKSRLFSLFSLLCSLY